MKSSRITAAVAAAVVIAVATLTACGQSPSESDEERVLRVAEPSPPGTFDGAGFFNTDGIAGAAVYDSLLIRREGLEVEPWLLTEFEYDDDRTLLSLVVRDDVDFIDGEHLDAEVVKLNLDLQRTDGLDAPYFNAIEEVVVTGDYTLEVHLSRPDSELLSFFAKKGVISPAAIDDREGLATAPVGSGPYLLESNEGDTEYVFVRNEDYWNPEAYPFDRIELTIMPDVTARMNALKSGQIDFAPIDIGTAAEAKSSGFTVYHYSAMWGGLLLGDRRGEISGPIGDVRVRRAIVMALDRVGYAAAAQGEFGNPSNQVGVEGQEGYYLPELADELTYDIEAARALLTEAGYPDGFDIRIPWHAGFTGEYQPYFEQAFADLGVRVEWVQMQDSDFEPEYFGNINAILPFKSYYNDLSLVKPDGQWNPWGNTDPETVELLATIEGGSDEEALEARTRLTEKILDEAWYAILAHETVIFAWDPGITASADGWGELPLYNVGIK